MTYFIDSAANLNSFWLKTILYKQLRRCPGSNESCSWSVCPGGGSGILKCLLGNVMVNS